MNDSIENYISLAEYAKMHGKESSTVRKKVLRGGFKTARKIGRNWMIDKNEPYVDERITSGKYVNWRDKYGKKK